MASSEALSNITEQNIITTDPNALIDPSLRTYAKTQPQKLEHAHKRGRRGVIARARRAGVGITLQPARECQPHQVDGAKKHLRDAQAKKRRAELKRTSKAGQPKVLVRVRRSTNKVELHRAREEMGLRRGSRPLKAVRSEAKLQLRYTTKRLQRLSQDAVNAARSDIPMPAHWETKPILPQYALFATPKQVKGRKALAGKGTHQDEKRQRDALKRARTDKDFQFGAIGVYCDKKHKKFVTRNGCEIPSPFTTRQTRAIIEMALIRGGIEENPGPPKKFEFSRRDKPKAPQQQPQPQAQQAEPAGTRRGRTAQKPKTPVTRAQRPLLLVQQKAPMLTDPPSEFRIAQVTGAPFGKNLKGKVADFRLMTYTGTNTSGALELAIHTDAVKTFKLELSDWVAIRLIGTGDDARVLCWPLKNYPQAHALHERWAKAVGETATPASVAGIVKDDDNRKPKHEKGPAKRAQPSWRDVSKKPVSSDSSEPEVLLRHGQQEAGKEPDRPKPKPRDLPAPKPKAKEHVHAEVDAPAVAEPDAGRQLANVVVAPEQGQAAEVEVDLGGLFDPEPPIPPPALQGELLAPPVVRGATPPPVVPSEPPRAPPPVDEAPQPQGKTAVVPSAPPLPPPEVLACLHHPLEPQVPSAPPKTPPLPIKLMVGSTARGFKIEEEPSPPSDADACEYDRLLDSSEEDNNLRLVKKNQRKEVPKQPSRAKRLLARLVHPDGTASSGSSEHEDPRPRGGGSDPEPGPRPLVPAAHSSDSESDSEKEEQTAEMLGDYLKTTRQQRGPIGHVEMAAKVLFGRALSDEREAIVQSVFGALSRVDDARVAMVRAPDQDNRPISWRGVKRYKGDFEVRAISTRPLFNWGVISALVLLSLVPVVTNFVFPALLGQKFVWGVDIVSWAPVFETPAIRLAGVLLEATLSLWPAMFTSLVNVAVCAATLKVAHMVIKPAESMHPFLRLSMGFLLVVFLLRLMPYVGIFMPPVVVVAYFIIAFIPLFGRRWLIYAPHLVTCLLTEYARGTSVELLRSTLHAKAGRLCAFPLPDRFMINGVLVTTTDVLLGTEEVVMFMMQNRYFGSCPPDLSQLGGWDDGL